MTALQFKLLYVCNGNNARSPLAVAATQQILTADPDGMAWDITSAGTEAIDGSGIRYEATFAAESLGLDLNDHLSKALQPDSCDAPDLVLAMSWEQVSHIWSLVPGAWDKVFTVKEFVHWAKRAPVRPPILFPDKLAEMRDKIVQAHAVRKRARADYGFWGGIRPQDLNLIEPNGKGPDAWGALAQAMHALCSDVIMLLRGPAVIEPKPKPKPRRTPSRAKRPQSRTRAKARR